MTNDSESAFKIRELEFQKEFELKKLDQDIRRMEARAGVQKVVYGTMVVGIVAALFPFLIALAELWTSREIEQIRADAIKREYDLQRELALKKNALELKTQSHSMLEKLAKEGRSEQLSKRIILAQYYKHLAVDGEERTRWEGFLSFLEELKEKEQEANKKLEIANTVKERVAAIREIKNINEITRPSIGFPWSMEFVRSVQVAINKAGRCHYPLDVDGSLGNITADCLAATLELDFDIIYSRFLRYQEGRKVILEALDTGVALSLPSDEVTRSWNKAEPGDPIFHQPAVVSRFGR